MVCDLLSLVGNTMPLAFSDSNGVQLNIGDYVKRPCQINTNIHGSWAVNQIIEQAGLPVLSYCYSEKGKIIPSGYTRTLLSDLYDHKILLWLKEGKRLKPCEEELLLLPIEQVDMGLVESTVLATERAW